MCAYFNMDDLNAGFFSIWKTKTEHDTFEAQNLKDIGVSKTLADALNGKTIADLQGIALKELNGKQDLNPELYAFSKAVFASHHDTGYESDEMRDAFEKVEQNLYMLEHGESHRGLSTEADYSAKVIIPKDGSASPLPTSLTSTDPYDETQHNLMDQRAEATQSVYTWLPN